MNEDPTVQAADSLRRLLTEIRAGRIEAKAAETRRLERAVAKLDAQGKAPVGAHPGRRPVRGSQEGERPNLLAGSPAALRDPDGSRADPARGGARRPPVAPPPSTP